jgi:hypothetical protein
MTFKQLTATWENIFYTILVLICIALVVFEEHLHAIEHSVTAYLRHFW